MVNTLSRHQKLVRLLAGVLLIALVSAGIWFGIDLDAEGFAGNILSELYGVLIGSAVALLVVDRYIARARSRQWAAVEAQTLQTLQSALTSTMIPVYRMLPTPRPFAADPAAMGSYGALAVSLNNLREQIQKLDPLSAHSLEWSVSKVVREAQAGFQLIRTVVVQRMLALSSSADLVGDIGVLETQFAECELQAIHETEIGLSPTEIRDLMVSFVSAAQQVATRIDEAQS